MNIDEKRKLAEWMGFRVWKNGEAFQTGKHTFNFRKFVDWNPDQNHEQFKEVWNKLTYRQKSGVTNYLYETDIKCYMDTVINELPKVMSKVMKVIFK